MDYSKHSFGKSLRQVIIDGADEKTALRELFEEKLGSRLDLKVQFSSFYWSNGLKYPFISLYLDDETIKRSLNKPELIKNKNIYYPTGSTRKDIFLCLNDAAKECGLSEAEFPEDDSVLAISIEAFDNAYANVFFDVNIAKIDKEMRKTLKNPNAMLRFRISSANHHYYLIFNSEEDSFKAQTSGLTQQISDFVNGFCKKNDTFHVFENYETAPLISSKEKLKQNGEIMAIMRDNPMFDGF